MNLNNIWKQSHDFWYFIYSYHINPFFCDIINADRVLKPNYRQKFVLIIEAKGRHINLMCCVSFSLPSPSLSRSPTPSRKLPGTQFGRRSSAPNQKINSQRHAYLILSQHSQREGERGEERERERDQVSRNSNLSSSDEAEDGQK